MFTKTFTQIAFVAVVLTATFAQAQAYSLFNKNGEHTARCDNGYMWHYADNSPISHATARTVCAGQGK